MNKKQQLALLEYFEEIRKAESAQNKLKAKFSWDLNGLKQLFKQIAGQNNFIRPSIFKQYLQPRMNVTENDLYVLFGKFDYQLSGKVSYQSFRHQLNCSSSFSEAIKDNSEFRLYDRFVQLLNCYIYHQDILNVCRKSLKQIVPYEAFDYIATQSKGFISKTELQTFFKQQQIKINSKSLDLLLKGLKRSYQNITLQAFCQNLNPIEFGFYQNYQKSINQQEEQRLKQLHKKQINESKMKKKQQDKLQRRHNARERVRQAEQNRKQSIQQLQKLKVKAQRQKEERQLLQKTLQKQQKIRHQLETQIQLFKKQSRCNQNDRKLLNRLHNLKNQQLNQSYELQERIINQQKYLQGLKQKVILQKNDLYHNSLANRNAIQLLRDQSKNQQLKELQDRQQLLYSRFLNPITQNSSVYNEGKQIGRLYSSKKYSDTPIHDLYKSTLGSTTGDFISNVYASQPQLKASYLFKY